MKHDQSTNSQIVLRVPSTLRATIETAAAEEGRSLANLTRRILEHWASRRGDATDARAA